MDPVPVWIRLLAVVATVAAVLGAVPARRPDSTVEVLDPFADVAATVAAVHDRGGRADCELRAGLWEPGRPDAARFDAALLGEATGPGRWLDIRALGPLLVILDDRVALCVAKGFDGVRFTALDGYRHRTGFPLTGADQAAFNRALTGLARGRGLSVDEAGDEAGGQAGFGPADGVAAGSVGTSTTSGS